MASHRRGQPVKVELYTYRTYSYLPVYDLPIIISVVILNSCVAPIRLNQAQGGGQNLIVHLVEGDSHRLVTYTRLGVRHETLIYMHARDTKVHHNSQVSSIALSLSRRDVARAPEPGPRCALRGFSQKSKNLINHQRQSRPPDKGNSRCPGPTPARVPRPLMAWRHRAPRQTLLPRARPSRSCP